MRRARAVPKRTDQTPEAVVVLLCLLSGAAWLALSLYAHRPL